MVAARDHDPPPAHDGSARGAQLGRELGRDLDVGETRDAVAPEERAAPALAPDEAHGQRGAVLDLLVRPDLDVGLDHAALAYSAKVGDDYALGQEGVRAHDALAADHGFLDHGAGTDLHPVPDHAALDVRPAWMSVSGPMTEFATRVPLPTWAPRPMMTEPENRAEGSTRAPSSSHTV